MTARPAFSAFRRALARLRRRARREDGTASIEFVILFPMFVVILISAVEVGVLLTRQVMLERAVDLAVRDLRLGRAAPEGEPITRDRIRDIVCENGPMVGNCRDNILIELQPINPGVLAGLAGPVACVERGEAVQPATAMNAGEQNELMLLRSCALVDPLFPTAGLALNLPRDSTGARALVAQSIFVNEPGG